MTGLGPTGTRPDVAPWRGRGLLYAGGVVFLAYGLRGIVQDVHGWTHPVYWAIVLVLFAVAHDLLLVPLVFAVAVPLRRLVPGPARPYLAARSALSGVAVALAWPGLRGDGRLPDNPSVLPLDYASGLRSVLLVLWLALLAAFLLHALRLELGRDGSARATHVVTPTAAAAPVPRAAPAPEAANGKPACPVERNLP